MTLQPITGLAAEPLGWAVERIRSASRLGAVPAYGSTEWDALDDRDPRRWAAVITAAESWRLHCSPEQVALDMRQALDEIDYFVLVRLKDAALDVSEATDWAVRASQPSHAELVRRRSA